MAARRVVVMLGKVDSEGGSSWDSGRISPLFESPGCVELKLKDMIWVVK